MKSNLVIKALVVVFVLGVIGGFLLANVNSPSGVEESNYVVQESEANVAKPSVEKVDKAINISEEVVFDNEEYSLYAVKYEENFVLFNLIEKRKETGKSRMISRGQIMDVATLSGFDTVYFIENEKLFSYTPGEKYTSLVMSLEKYPAHSGKLSLLSEKYLLIDTGSSHVGREQYVIDLEKKDDVYSFSGSHDSYLDGDEFVFTIYREIPDCYSVVEGDCREAIELSTVLE